MIYYGENDWLLTWELPDGTIVQAEVCRARRPGESQEEFDAYVYWAEAKGRPENAVWIASRVKKSDSPTAAQGASRFKSARRLDRFNARVVFDLPTVRRLILAEVREERKSRLEASDHERARIEDVGNDQQKQAVKAYRQALRDFPAVVQAKLAALGTYEQLLAYRPTWPEAV